MKNSAVIIPSVSAIDSESLARHRWYFFKEGFSPEIVNHAIKQTRLKPGSLVYDPFSGSGTTALTAAMNGMKGAGAEVNPFLRFVAKTKTLRADAAPFGKALKRSVAGAQKGADTWLKTFSTFTNQAAKAKKQGKWLFNASVLNAFQGAWNTTLDLSKSEQALIRLCLLGAAMDVANAEKDGKCLRYKPCWKQQRFNRADFIQALEARASIVLEDIEATRDQPLSANIQLGDSRELSLSDPFDLCVTSPPYLNSFDYTDVYRPELFLGGFVSSMDQLSKLRRATLRSHLQAAWNAPTEDDFGKLYAETITALHARLSDLQEKDETIWNKKIPVMVQAYFEDISRILTNLRAKAKRNASVWLVVSTSAYSGIEIPVDLIIAEIGTRTGWALREVQVLRNLRRVACQQWDALNERVGVAGPYLRESLVVLDANPRR